MKLEKVLYRASSKATGGRDGSAISSDNALNVQLSTPKELGGGGGNGTNPEQLFAMRFVAGQQKITLPENLSITGNVGIGPIASGFGIEAELQISLPGMDRAAAQNLIEKAHQVCPYSNATRGNINVTLKLV
jgi:Ohr subfamily peroxiredoxin